MIAFEIFRSLALSLPEITEEPHFDKISFRIKGKIIATYDPKYHRATLKLSEREQDLFCLIDKSKIYPVANSWGKQGWTIFELNELDESLLEEALKIAFQEVSLRKK